MRSELSSLILLLFCSVVASSAVTFADCDSNYVSDSVKQGFRFTLTQADTQTVYLGQSFRVNIEALVNVTTTQVTVQSLDILTKSVIDGSEYPSISTSQNYNTIIDGKDASDLGFTFDIPQYTDVISYTSELRYSGQIGTQTNKAIGCLRMTYTITPTNVVILQAKVA